jgi:competence protein ComEC
MNPRNAVLCALSSITGVWLAKQFSMTGMLAAAFLVIIITIQLKRKSFLFLFSLLFFFTYTHLYDTWHRSMIPPDATFFQGQITTIPEMNGRNISFHFHTYGEAVMVRYRMKSETEKHRLMNLQVNMNCFIHGRIEEPDSLKRFYSMDYKAFLNNKKIFWILIPESIPLEKCTVSAEKGWIEQIKSWRTLSIDRMEENFSPTSAGLMNALLFGYRDGIDTDILKTYQELGLTHLLAVSGFNVGIITYFLYMLLVRIGLLKEIAVVLILAFLPIYIVLTGGESSIVRAGIMGMVVLGSFLLRKKGAPAVLLASVFMAMLLYAPGYAFDLGFQLSFLMTFILISSARLIQKKPFFHVLLMTSFMCSLFSFPIIVFHFFEFSIWSVPFNLVYIPLVSMVLFPLAFFAYLSIMVFPQTLPIFEVPVNILFEASVLLLERAKPSIGNLILGRPSIGVVMVYFISLLFLFFRWEKRGGFHFWHILPFLSVIVLQSIIPFLNPTAAITFINVGQGDSILVELPYRRGVYLIDTGGSLSIERENWEVPDKEFNVTEHIVHPYLKGRGIRKLDILLISHRDIDHAGGARYLIDELRVDNLYMPDNMDRSQLEVELITEAVRRGVNIRFADRGMSWGDENTRFLIMHPSQKKKFSNNQSIVLWASIFNSSFLFTGDIEEEAEKDIAEYYSTLQVHVLKIAHHGSRTSTTEPFLNKILPKYAVLSLGENNRYGHPDPGVINRLKERNIRIFRTDLQGDILFNVSKKGLKVVSAR